MEAKGKRGPCIEYLKQTIQYLRKAQIYDSKLEDLYQYVREIQSQQASQGVLEANDYLPSNDA